MLFEANFWICRNGDQDEPIPNSFFNSKRDFLNSVEEVKATGGKGSIVGATGKLNQWSIYNALIVVYTASPQNLIDIAGYNYTEQVRTVGIHLNDGVDIRPISDYPSPQMSEYSLVAELIKNACKQLPEKRTTTYPVTTSSLISLSTTTAKAITTTKADHTSSSTLISSHPSTCHGLFVIDGSNRMGNLGSFIVETNLIKASALLAYSNLTIPFTGNYWMYGNGNEDQDVPSSFIGKLSDFENQIDLLDSYNGKETIAGAVNQLNGWSENAIIVLFTNSLQQDVDSAAKIYSKYGMTLGIPLTAGLDLSKLATITKEQTDLQGIRDAIEALCLGKIATTTSTSPTTPVTTTPIPIAKALFVLDASDLETSIVAEKLLVSTIANTAFNSGTMIFSANVWEYGDDPNDPPIPTDFYDNAKQFGDALDDLVKLGGKEYIMGATNKLNNWPITDAIVVLITASSESQINMAKYLKVNQTVGLSVQDGVDMSNVAVIWMGLNSNSNDIVKAIHDVALTLPKSIN